MCFSIRFGSLLLLAFLDPAELFGQEETRSVFIPQNAAIVLQVDNVSSLFQHLNGIEDDVNELLLEFSRGSQSNRPSDNEVEDLTDKKDQIELGNARLTVIITESTDRLGELIVVLQHSKKEIAEPEREAVSSAVQVFLRSLAKVFPETGSIERGKLFDKLLAWERNRFIEFRPNQILFATDKVLINRSVAGEAATVNRGFEEASANRLSQSDFFLYISPINSRALMTGVGLPAASRWNDLGLDEFPWLMVSGSFERNPDGMDFGYRATVKSTLPLSGRARLWSCWRPVDIYPAFPFDVDGVSASRIDADCYDRVMKEVSPDSYELVSKSQFLMWNSGLSQKFIGDTSFSFTVSNIDVGSETGTQRLGRVFVRKGRDDVELERILDARFNAWVSDAGLVGGENKYGGSPIKFSHLGRPAWRSAENSGRSQVAVVGENYFYEGDEHVFEHLSKQQFVFGGENSVELKRHVHSTAEKLGIRGPVVLFSRRKKTDLGEISAFYFNLAIRNMPGFHYLSKEDFAGKAELLKNGEELSFLERNQARMGKIVGYIDSLECVETEVQSFDEKAGKWEFGGRFEIQFPAGVGK